jgi:hypothetical protein
VLRDDTGHVLAKEPYVLRVGRQDHHGTTDARGRLEESIPVGACEGELHLKTQRVTFPLAIGHLDPIEDRDDSSVTSVKARLNNLGFHCGAVDNVRAPRTAAAIRSFQKQVLCRKDPDGVLDAQTYGALISHHGC